TYGAASADGHAVGFACFGGGAGLAFAADGFAYLQAAGLGHLRHFLEILRFAENRLQGVGAFAGIGAGIAAGDENPQIVARYFQLFIIYLGHRDNRYLPAL